MNFKSLPTQPRSQGPLLPGPTEREKEPRNDVAANIDIFNHIQFLISAFSEGAVDGGEHPSILFTPFLETPCVYVCSFFGRRELERLYYYMRNFCILIGLEQWYFTLICNTYMWKLQTFCGKYYKHIKAWFVRDIWYKYHSWYFKIVSNFTRLTARENMYNNFKYHYKSRYYLYQYDVIFSSSIVFKISFRENTQYLLNNTLHKKNPEVCPR